MIIAENSDEEGESSVQSLRSGQNPVRLLAVSESDCVEDEGVALSSVDSVEQAICDNVLVKRRGTAAIYQS